MDITTEVQCIGRSKKAIRRFEVCRTEMQEAGGSFMFEILKYRDV